MSDLTARMLAKAEAAKRFRDLEEAAAQSQRDVRAGLRDPFGKTTKKGRQPAKPKPAPTPRHSNRPDRTDEIIAAYKAGLNFKQISIKLGINQEAVSRTVTEAGLRPALIRTTATDAEVVEMYKSGMTFAAITQATRMTRERISAAVRAAGVPVRGVTRQDSCQREGHDWSDPKNVRNRADGTRICAECQRQDARDRYHAKKEAA